MKSIVVPIDFSTCSSNAARYAADLALAINADLHLIHVIQVPLTAAELSMTESVYRDMIEGANLSLKKIQADLTKRTLQRIRIDILVDAGSVTGKVHDLCRQVNAYAIVLGVSGPKLEKFLAGSPVTSLLQHLEYPVLVVPEAATFQQFRRILMAFDLEDIGSGLTTCLPLLKELRGHFGSRVDIITVETRKVLSDEATCFESGGWKEQLRDIYPEIHYIRKSKVEDGILEYLGQHQADLVMVFPKKHGFFDFHISQSRRLAQSSPVPVMSLHV